MGDLFGSTPEVATQEPEELVADKKKAKKSRVALLETAGGRAGEELTPDQVQKRPTIFGN